MAQINEAALIRQAQRGDTAAMGELLQRHRDRLYAVCLRMVSNRDDAAELTQETLMRVVENLERFQAKAKLTTWMTRIAMNLCISHLRKRKTRHTLRLDTSPGDEDSEAPDQAAALRASLADHREPSPEQSVQSREMVELLQSKLATLDEDFRAVIVLRDVEQMDYAQMAEVLDVPVGTVKSRLFRARLALREALTSSSGHSAWEGVSHG